MLHLPDAIHCNTHCTHTSARCITVQHAMVDRGFCNFLLHYTMNYSNLTLHTHCCMLHHAATHQDRHMWHLFTATHCNTLQHTATQRTTLHHTAPHCNTPRSTDVRAWNTLKCHAFVFLFLCALKFQPRRDNCTNSNIHL